MMCVQQQAQSGWTHRLSTPSLGQLCQDNMKRIKYESPMTIIFMNASAAPARKLHIRLATSYRLGQKAVAACEGYPCIDALLYRGQQLLPLACRALARRLTACCILPLSARRRCPR